MYLEEMARIIQTLTKSRKELIKYYLNVFSQVQQLVGVVNGTVMYNVTPSILMAEWHSLYTTSLQYVTALQKLQTELNEDYFAAWIPGNISVGLSQILLTRSETYYLSITTM